MDKNHLKEDANVTIVTTFNDDGYSLYGKNMLKSFDKKMPKINFLAYYEGSNPDLLKETSRIKYIDLEKMCPDLVAFKKRWKDVPAANGEFRGVKSFKYHAVRFSHKMFCIYHAATTVNSKYLIWCDADTEAKKKFDKKTLTDMLPVGKYCAYLGRPKVYSECGFMIFDTTHPQHMSFMNQYIEILNSGKFLEEKEWHDSYLFDVIRKRMEKEYKIFHNLTPNTPKSNFNIALKPYITHYKGSRKLTRGRKSNENYNLVSGNKK
tara:strand:+ start:290 stop:1081 length:792 start_codon:yes stop_codon:yes gene_type:complete